MAQLSIQLLGPLTVKRDGEIVSGFESNKVRALLAYLAAENSRPQPRDHLAGLLWPGWPQPSAVSNLRKALSDLRKNIADQQAEPPFLLICRESIQFNIKSDSELDLAEPEKMFDLTWRGALSEEDLRRVGDCCQGEFLEGFSLPDAPEFETWVLAKRAYYRQKQVQLLARLAEHCEQAGELERGLAYAQRQLVLEPGLEEAHRQAMRMLALSGQRTAALLQFETCRKELERELGVQPAEETVRLYESIRNGELKGMQPGKMSQPVTVGKEEAEPQHNLPLQMTRFIGRQRECGQVRGLLDQHRLVTLIGPGGVGKTRLALRVAEDVVEEFTHGVWYVELAPVVDPGLVEQTVAVVLGLRPDQSVTVFDALRKFLQHKQLLLLLDNCEHLVETCAHLANRLLQGCPQVKLLVSSREALGIPGEAVYRMPSMALPERQTLVEKEDLLSYESVALFVDRAGAVLPGFEVTESNAENIVQICQRLDGVPLAIELAAARMNVLTTEQLYQRLENSFNLLTGGARTALPRQQTLRTTIDWSYQLLSNSERLLLGRLAVFSGGCTLESAEEICSSEGLESERILDLLTSLVNKSMVNVDRIQGTEARYRLFETVRQYAREKLFDAGESKELRDRHLGHFVRVAETGYKQLMTEQRLVWTKRLKAELDNLRAAVEWAYTGGEDIESGLRIAAALGFRFLPAQGYGMEAERWVKTGLSAAETLKIPDMLRAQAMMALEWLIHIRSGDAPKGAAVIIEAIRLCREIGAQANPERVYALGRLAGYQKELAEAQPLWDEAMAIAAGVDREKIWFCTDFLLCKGLIEYKFRDLEAMCMSAQAALSLFGPEGCTDRWSAATAYIILGSVELAQGQHSQGLTHIAEALALYSEAEDRIGCAGASCGMAMGLIRQGEYERAIYPNDQALRNWHSVGKEKYVAAHLVFLGIILVNLGSAMGDQDARERFRQAVVLFSNADAYFAADAELSGFYMDTNRSGAEQILQSKSNPKEYMAAWAEGQTMSLEQAVALATKIAREWQT
jgi:non-specific serine/threonine protein kinase